MDHLAFACGGKVVRIDIAGRVSAGAPVLLQFNILADERLDDQMQAIRRLFSAREGPIGNAQRLMRQHLALLAADANSSGASLRETAEIVMGTGDWPGDGESRKSQTRRLIDTGARLLAGGPASALKSGQV